MFRAIKRVFIWLGLMAEKATETDAINQAVVERGIRDAKVKADKAHLRQRPARRPGRDAEGPGQAPGASARRSSRACSRPPPPPTTRPTAPITPRSWPPSNRTSRTTRPSSQGLEELYQQNTADHRREPPRDSEVPARIRATKARVAIGRSLENLADADEEAPSPSCRA